MQATAHKLKATALEWNPNNAKPLTPPVKQKQHDTHVGAYQSPTHHYIPGPPHIDTTSYAMAGTTVSPNAVYGPGVFSPYSGMHVYHQVTPEARYQIQVDQAKSQYDFYRNKAHQDYQHQIAMLPHYYTPNIQQAFESIDQVYAHQLAAIDQSHKVALQTAEEQFRSATHSEQAYPSVAEATYSHHNVFKTSSEKSFGMPPLGSTTKSHLANVGIGKMPAAESHHPTFVKKLSVNELEEAEKKMDTPTPIAKKKPPSEALLIEHTAALTLGDNLTEKATDLPDTRPVFERATSDSQTITNSLNTFITPTTANILAKVPINYSDLLHELETALKAPGVTTYLTPGAIVNLMGQINDTIMRSFYSQITDRHYVPSKTPSPTTLLTVLHEIQKKQDIKGKNHAKKLGIILREIKAVMTTLKTIRDGQPKTENGDKLTEISRLFVAFFNKIGVLGVDAISLYELKLKKKIKNINIPALNAFFKKEAVENNDVFFFYALQATGKKHLSGEPSGKKLTFSGEITTQNPKFKEDTHTISQRLSAQNNTSSRTVNLMDFIKPGKVPQGAMKRAMKAAAMSSREDVIQEELRYVSHEGINSNDSSFVEDDGTNPNDISFQEDRFCSIRDIDDTV